MNKLKYFLIIFVLLFSLPVYAAEYNMNSKTSATQDGTKNRYRGVEITETGMPLTFTFGTRYTGKLSTIETYFDYPFEANTTYTLTYNMNTEDFRNNFAAKYWWDCDNEMNATNQHVGSFTYVSYKKVKFSFTPTENTTCIRVLIGSSNQSSQAITGISNWRLDSITLYDPDYQSGSSGSQGSTPSPSPSPSGATNQDIINNQNNNTQDIINNNNQNTQDIIENNNENTDKITDSINDSLNNKCDNLFDINQKVENLSINSSGGFVADNTSWLNYVAVESGKSYTISSKVARQWVFNFSSDVPYLAQSGSTRVVTTADNITFSVPDGYNYFVLRSYPDSYNSSEHSDSQDIMLVPGTAYKNYCTFNSNTSNKLDDINDTLKDESVPTIDIDLDVASDTPIIDLIYMPLTFISKVLDYGDNTCQPYTIPFDFSGGNNTLTLPCINLRNILGNDFYNILNAIISFYIAYNIGLMCVTIYNDITSLRDGFRYMYYSNDPNVIGFGKEGDE